MPRFRRIPVAVEAVQFDPTATEQPKGVLSLFPKAWCDPVPCVKTASGDIKPINAGDWLLLSPNGVAFDVWPDKAFRMAYEPV